jgi:hypothetical protein
MTLHIFYSHQCPQCAAYYIPYGTDVPCPKCGSLETERFDFIPKAVASLRYNLERNGSYKPGAWMVASFGDNVLYILFGVFERFRQQTSATDFSDFAATDLSRMNWGDQDYLRQHVLEIALSIWQTLNTKPD